MWMMGYNEPHEDHINMLEAYNNGSRKLRPLVPRPLPPNCAATTSSNRFHNTHHQHLVAAEQNKRELNSQQMVVVSSRWNPTPEQLQTLEELYRRGTRTPSADEIQHITAQLRRYGKIEGKNVFYWFQNHKARERQKRRRQLDNPTTNELHQTPFFTSDINTINHDDQPIIQNKHSDVEETRNWEIPTFSEKSVIRKTTGKTEDEENDQLMVVHRSRRKSIPARNATWSNMMQCLSSNHITLINSSSCSSPTQAATLTTPDVDSYETLELFPINSNGQGKGQPEKCYFPTNDVCVSPRQFIEFLPLKN